MTRPQMIRGIVFDKDGTLLDFEATWLPSFKRIAHMAAGGDAALIRRLLAIGGLAADAGDGGAIESGSLFAAGNPELIARAWMPFVYGHSQDALASAIEDIFMQEAALNARALFEVAPVFECLKANGIAIGIATSDSEQGLGLTLSGLDILHLVDFSCGYDSGFGFKPEPGMVEAFCAAVRIGPHETAVIGDNPHDLEMGRRAGSALTIGVLNGTSAAGDLAPVADVLLSSAEDILTLLQLDTGRPSRR